MSLEILYNNTPIIRGHQLPINLVNQPPQYTFPYQPNKNYILIMVDPDAPSHQNPTNKFWLHWIVTNITKKNLGSVLVDYEPPFPPTGSGPHRYEFYLCENNNNINFYPVLEKTKITRGKFDLHNFVSNYNLKIIATTYFIAER